MPLYDESHMNRMRQDAIRAAEPYCTAVKNAAKLKLCGNERTYGKLVGRGLFFATALMYELRTRIRR